MAASNFGPVIMVPGLMGSQLVFDGGEFDGKTLWADPIRIGNPNAANYMLLDKDGNRPLEGFGRALKPQGFVAPYYTGWDLTLEFQADKYKLGKITQLAWDWRKTFKQELPRFYSAFTTAFFNDGPVNLVGHSAGGLFCRYLYSHLVDQGEEQRCRRIVLVGTPNLGSFEAAAGLAAQQSFYNSWIWRSLYGSQGVVLTTPSGVVRTTNQFWGQLAGTWPGMYQLLPWYRGVDVASRKQLDRIYTATNYQYPVYLNQDWFDYARGINWPRLWSPSYFPPQDKLWVLLGTDYPTISGFTPDTSGVDEAAFAKPVTSDGDSVVTFNSQTLRFSTKRGQSADHRAEPSTYASNEMIAKALTDPPQVEDLYTIIKNPMPAPDPGDGVLKNFDLTLPVPPIPMGGKVPGAELVGDP
jgi:pimeloyl-ACP methyl ester carboxylesterase